MTSGRPPRLLVLRHGETEWNRERRIQGQSESRLTETGRDHARAQGRILARLLNDATGEIDLFCSPLRRTRETAALALPERAGDIRFDPRIMEIHLGSWEGHLWSDLVARHPALGDAGVSVFKRCFRSPDGEDFAALSGRIDSFLAELDRTSVIVTHGVAGAVIRGRALGLDREGMARLDHGQGVVYVLENGSERVETDAAFGMTAGSRTV